MCVQFVGRCSFCNQNQDNDTALHLVGLNCCCSSMCHFPNVFALKLICCQGLAPCQSEDEMARKQALKRIKDVEAPWPRSFHEKNESKHRTQGFMLQPGSSSNQPCSSRNHQNLAGVWLISTQLESVCPSNIEI